MLRAWNIRQSSSSDISHQLHLLANCGICLQEAFRRLILEPGPPENFALQTVQEVIKPQVIISYLHGLSVIFFSFYRTSAVIKNLLDFYITCYQTTFTPSFGYALCICCLSLKRCNASGYSFSYSIIMDIYLFNSKDVIDVQ